MVTDREEAIRLIEQKFGNRILKSFRKTKKRLYIDIKPGDAPEVVTYIFRDLGARHNISTGVDTPDGIEVLYHFQLDKALIIITVRTFLDRMKPRVQSLAVSIPAFNWIEREIHELLGVEFVGHPDMRKLLLSDDWPEGKHPLRRDFEGV